MSILITNSLKLKDKIMLLRKDETEAPSTLTNILLIYLGQNLRFHFYRETRNSQFLHYPIKCIARTVIMMVILYTTRLTK
jgi:hypothetical protein